MLLKYHYYLTIIGFVLGEFDLSIYMKIQVKLSVTGYKLVSTHLLCLLEYKLIWYKTYSKNFVPAYFKTQNY